MPPASKTCRAMTLCVGPKPKAVRFIASHPTTPTVRHADRNGRLISCSHTKSAASFAPNMMGPSPPFVKLASGRRINTLNDVAVKQSNEGILVH